MTTKYLQKKYALSEQGAKDLFKGIIYSALAYISLMLPVALGLCAERIPCAPAGRGRERRQRPAVHGHRHHHFGADLPAALHAVHGDLSWDLSRE